MNSIKWGTISKEKSIIKLKYKVCKYCNNKKPEHDMYDKLFCLHCLAKLKGVSSKWGCDKCHKVYL